RNFKSGPHGEEGPPPAPPPSANERLFILARLWTFGAGNFSGPERPPRPSSCHRPLRASSRQEAYFGVEVYRHRGTQRRSEYAGIPACLHTGCDFCCECGGIVLERHRESDVFKEQKGGFMQLRQ